MSGVIKGSEGKEQTRNYILMIFTQLPIKKSIYMLQALKNPRSLGNPLSAKPFVIKFDLGTPRNIFFKVIKNSRSVAGDRHGLS